MVAVDEPVEFVSPCPEWPSLFEAEAVAVRQALGTFAVAVERIGSTAVPGPNAKPVVDMQVGVAGEPSAASVGRALTELGYEGLGDAGVPGRLYFRKRGPVSYNLHVVAFGGGHWVANLAVRDYLRAHPAAAAEYAARKREAAAGSVGLLVYSDRKAAFVAELVRRALAWVQEAARGVAADQGRQAGVPRSSGAAAGPGG
jgi:GrpB-like predicted nucleotidyltransferase (UPF0157 family)